VNVPQGVGTGIGSVSYSNYIARMLIYMNKSVRARKGQNFEFQKKKKKTDFGDEPVRGAF